MNQQYGNLTSTLHSNWNLSIYARTQKEQRLETYQLSKEQQQERLKKVYNNRPPIYDSQQIKPNNKKIVGFENHEQVKQKSHLGVINPEHYYEDPREIMAMKKQKDEEWFQNRTKVKELEIQADKIHLRPPPLLEREKPFMQEHLVSPYIYIKKIIKKNSADVHMSHPDIWDTSTNKRSTRMSKQEQRVSSAAEQKKQQQNEREEFYLQNLKMREFLFKFFKTINRLLKEKRYSKVIYKGDSEQYDLQTLFKLWAQHKNINIDSKLNPESYVSKEQFCDFLLVIGLNPEKIREGERFFDYNHDMVLQAQQQSGQANEKGVIVPKWWKMFEGEQQKTE